MVYYLAQDVYSGKGGYVLIHTKQNDIHIEEYGPNVDHHIQVGAGKLHNPAGT